MKIALISQKIIKDKYNQTNFSLEDKWINFFEKKEIILVPIFSKQKNIDSYFKKLKPSCVIISGGSNNIFDSSQENILRRKIDSKLLNISIKKKIPILAVCYGFQYVAKLLGGKVIKSKKELQKNHYIYIDKRRIKVNSFHNYSVKELPKHFEIIGVHKDGYVEIAYAKKFNILCTMFHPERKNISQKYVDNLILKFLNL
jgi:gamma-glutamyl-gamma-aminobutyrate hydrolase PuuD|tara:strand:+ start:796 stop:1395 length:600 start_codon:yes stop_codon:yes gene_type:complete